MAVAGGRGGVAGEVLELTARQRTGIGVGKGCQLSFFKTKSWNDVGGHAKMSALNSRGRPILHCLLAVHEMRQQVRLLRLLGQKVRQHLPGRQRTGAGGILEKFYNTYRMEPLFCLMVQSVPGEQ